MKNKICALVIIFLPFLCAANEYPVFSKTLPNGLKIIACEKPGNSFVEVEVWYRVGSKDEKPGIRGMAHLFEHMMFRGTKKYPADAVFENVKAVGGNNNAYTTYDRTVYHEYVPLSALEKMLDVESDRMSNLVVTQDILNTEREVVGQELRNGQSNWYQNMHSERYPFLYPQGHPYEVDVIGYLNEITAFTAGQCMEFYANYYSPNNAFVVIVGNIRHEEVFSMVEKYFGLITKQLDLKKNDKVPDIFTAQIRKNEMGIDFPVQIYSYITPRPSVGEADYFPVKVLTEMLFTNANSILNNRLVKKDFLAYVLYSSTDDWNVYPNLGVIDVIMGASPGNVKVKKVIREEINKIVAEGIPQEMIDNYLASMEAQKTLSAYSSGSVASELGMAEYYFYDYRKAGSMIENYKKVTQEDLKRVAATYFSEEKIQFINIKPQF